MIDSTRYFATLPPGEIGPALMERVDAYYRYLDAIGLAGLIRRSKAQRLGANLKNGTVSWEVREAGEQGEFKLSTENHYRQLGEHKVTLTTQQRPAIQCSAANSDKKSLEQTMLGDGLVEYHLTERKLEHLLKRAVERAVFESEGFIEGCWDTHAGDDVAPEMDEFSALLDRILAGEDVSGAAVPVRKSGEPTFFCLGPLDVARDPCASSFAECRWLITRRLVSKFELAARYPDMRDKVLLLNFRPELQHYPLNEFGRGADEQTDLVPVWTLYHERTAAVPEGKHVILAASDCVFFDGPLPYRAIPVKRMAPAEMADRPNGWTPMFDLLGPQEVVGAIDTTIVSNELGRGVGNLVTDDNSDVSVEALSSSMNLIKKKPNTELKALEWPTTPAEFFGYKQEKIGAMATLVGTNPVAMGTPNELVGKDGSGAKMALFEATATRNNSALEQSYADCCRDVAQLVIHLYRDFGGSVERQAKIAGKSKGYLLKSFTSDDLADIDRVKVDLGNPILRTVAGKMSVAEKMVELGIIKPGEADKFLHVLKEGSIEPLIEAKQAQLLRIRGENEALQEGAGQHRALLTDPHWQEIPEHLALLDNPALREPSPENEAIQAAVLEAVQQHIDLFLQMPPWMVLMRGGPEAMAMWQQIGAMMMGGPAGTPPPAPGEPSGTKPPPRGEETPTNPNASKPGAAGLPSMPNNPATGQPADVGAGMMQ